MPSVDARSALRYRRRVALAGSFGVGFGGALIVFVVYGAGAVIVSGTRSLLKHSLALPWGVGFGIAGSLGLALALLVLYVRWPRGTGSGNNGLVSRPSGLPPARAWSPVDGAGSSSGEGVGS